jgi:ParB-like chromosome segregation protein Spo0J
MCEKLVNTAKHLFSRLDALPVDERIEAINEIRLALREHSPFKAEPVDCVLWVKSSVVIANDYNPNSVAPTEMKLLEHSIQEDGYTQPIVSWANESSYEVIDGFHRHRVGKESKSIQARVHGYLPLVVVNDSRLGLGDRMASTIRHNRARGKHKVEAMSEIVVELKRRFWSDEKIAKELGMEPDEVLRLTQITGLTDMFADAEFSEAWEAESFADIDSQPAIEEVKDED